MEKTSQYKYSVEPFSEDFCGNLSWGFLGNLLLRCASMHAGEHGFGYQQMIKMRHAWVLSRLVIEMDELPRTGEDFSIVTWVSRVYRQFTDRHFSVLRPDGTAYGHATSIWSLIDTETRQPADLTKLPDGGFTDILIPERPAPIAQMGRVRLNNPELVAKHKAAYTDLDINGHVNSIRYIEMMLDRFPATGAKEQPVRRIEMAYSQEAYCGDELQILQALTPADSNCRLFKITNEAGQTITKGSISVHKTE